MRLEQAGPRTVPTAQHARPSIIAYEWIMRFTTALAVSSILEFVMATRASPDADLVRTSKESKGERMYGLGKGGKCSGRHHTPSRYRPHRMVCYADGSDRSLDG